MYNQYAYQLNLVASFWGACSLFWRTWHDYMPSSLTSVKFNKEIFKPEEGGENTVILSKLNDNVNLTGLSFFDFLEGKALVSGRTFLCDLFRMLAEGDPSYLLVVNAFDGKEGDNRVSKERYFHGQLVRGTKDIISDDYKHIFEYKTYAITRPSDEFIDQVNQVLSGDTSKKCDINCLGLPYDKVTLPHGEVSFWNVRQKAGFSRHHRMITVTGYSEEDVSNNKDGIADVLKDKILQGRINDAGEDESRKHGLRIVIDNITFAPENGKQGFAMHLIGDFGKVENNSDGNPRRWFERKLKDILPRLVMLS